MILSGMTSTEMIKEYYKDYEILKQRFFGYIRSHKKEIGIKDSWTLINEPRTATIDGTKYRSIIRAQIKPEGVGFINTTYTILNESETGKHIVLQFPRKYGEKYIIQIDNKFLNNYKNIFSINKSGLELIDDFMRNMEDIVVYERSDGNNDLNCLIRFKNNTIGFGWMEENKIILKKLRTKERILEIAENLGYKENDTIDPFEIYIKHLIPSTPKNLNYELEMELKWEEECRKQEQELNEIFEKYG